MVDKHLVLELPNLDSAEEFENLINTSRTFWRLRLIHEDVHHRLADNLSDAYPEFVRCGDCDMIPEECYCLPEYEPDYFDDFDKDTDNDTESKAGRDK